MQDLIPPHGGLSQPVDRSVPAAEIAEFTRQAGAFKKVPVSDADLSSLYRFGDAEGAARYHPTTGASGAWKIHPQFSPPQPALCRTANQRRLQFFDSDEGAEGA